MEKSKPIKLSKKKITTPLEIGVKETERKLYLSVGKDHKGINAISVNKNEALNLSPFKIVVELDKNDYDFLMAFLKNYGGFFI